MLRILGYATGTVAFAAASGFVIFIVWNQLVRAEIVANATLEWFPVVAVVWGCLSLGAGALLCRARQADRQPSSHRRRAG